ncbi:MAG: L-arabinose isomerase family protein [Planctomycetota bacterium]
MSARASAGLLPLYLELYDRAAPKARPVLEGFVREIGAALAARGLEVETAPVCRTEPEFAAAVANFERSGADAIVTLHLAYSPSEECIGPLSETYLPVVILDTTPDAEFGTDVDPSRIMYNHGIHGVQDMCNLLRRRGKRYEIVAGHWKASDALGRCADAVKVARAAGRLRSTRALRIGESFRGMGDFSVPEKVMKSRLGITVKQVAPAGLTPFVEKVSADDLEAELERDRKRFEVDCPEEIHRRSARLGLGLRAMLAEGGHAAFSVNFLAFDSESDVVPFLEASKAMARGIGYAGEGDVLTAALVGALLSAWPQTTFTEIFCPDWEGGTLFLSHMGEFNPACAAGRPLLCERPFPYTPAANPAVLACAPEPGEAVFVNLAPGPEDSFTLIAAPVEVLGDGKHPEMRNKIRGWMRPRVPVAEFLEEYSHLGGTHHSALVLGTHARSLRAFARLAGLGYRAIE